MPVNLMQYRGTVGIFKSQHFVFDLKHKDRSLLIHSHGNVFFISTPPFLVAVIKAWLAAWFYNLLLLLSGDVELNLGPKCNYRTAFSICHWNLNSISAHNYAKVFFSLRLILQFVSLILFVYQKYTLILVLLLMITIWKFLGTP